MKASLPHRSVPPAPGMPRRGQVHRSLHPAGQRSHDERCSSGSGWGSARSREPARANARGHHRRCRLGSAEAGASRAMARVGYASASSGPWPVNLGWLLPVQRCGASAPDCGAAALPVLGAGTASGVASAAHDTDPRRQGTRGRKLPRARADAGERGERSARAHAGLGLACEAGIGRSCGRARGSSWLQKSTSGARSRPEGHGSSSLAPRSGGRAQVANRRRKPGRGGESRQHASSDTGGGLLVIPRATAQADRASGGGSTRRWKASWCGEGRRL